MARSIAKSLAAALLAGALLAGCGGGDQSFTTPTYPFSFDYPAGWRLSRGANFTYGSSDAAVRSVSAALKEPYDQVTITQYKLKKTLPAGTNGYQPEVDRIVARLTKQAGGSAGDAKVVKYGGQPGYRYVVEYPGGNNLTLENKLTFLFKGQYEFQVNCQSSKENREALNEGCDQILDSLKFK
ncbi:MAG: hypothetical protein ACSLFF_09230 [Solirubrobacterales bacterium]